MELDNIFKDNPFASFIESNNEIIQIYNTEGQLIYVNSEGARVLGINIEDVDKYSVWDFNLKFTEENRSVWEGEIEKIKAKYSVDYLDTITNISTRKNYNLSITSSLINFKNIEYILLSSKEISSNEFLSQEIVAQNQIIREIFMAYKKISIHGDFRESINHCLNKIYKSIDVSNVLFFVKNTANDFHLIYNHNEVEDVNSIIPYDTFINTNIIREKNSVELNLPINKFIKTHFGINEKEKFATFMPFSDSDSIIGFTALFRIKKFQIDYSTFQQYRNITNSYFLLLQKKVALDYYSKVENDFSNSINDVFFLYDINENRYTYVSSSCNRLFGVSYDKFKDFEHFGNTYIHPEDRESFFINANKIRTQKSIQFEYRIIHQDGSIKNIRSKIFAVINKDSDEINEISGICSEINIKNQDELILNINGDSSNLDSVVSLKMKQSDIYLKSIEISEKNKLLIDIKYYLEDSQVDEDLDRDKMVSFVKKIDKALKNKEDSWDEIQIQYKKIRPNFFKKLIQHEPKLSSNEIKYCYYIDIEKTNKEISIILKVSIRTVETTKYRLKKKMKISDSISIRKYLNELD